MLKDGVYGMLGAEPFLVDSVLGMLGPSISDSGSAFERVFDRVGCLFNSPGRQEREAGESGHRRSLVAIMFYKQVCPSVLRRTGGGRQ